mmetsp:Transcript_11177/g.23155  ORF Transcript_11177/g.23155 Transcript_11177/m.23155 type:complete len:279 (-) Transcript_11177:51-887(-)
MRTMICVRFASCGAMLYESLGLGVFQFRQFFQNLRGMPSDSRFHVRKDPAELSIGVDNVGLSIREGSKSGNREGASVGLGHLSPLVAQHEKVEFFLRAKLGILFNGIDAHAHNLGIELSVTLEIALEATGLERAARRKGSRIKVQDGPLGVLDQPVQSHQTASPGVGEFESGGLGALSGQATGVRSQGRFGGNYRSQTESSGGDGSGFDKGPACSSRITVFVVVVVVLLKRETRREGGACREDNGSNCDSLLHDWLFYSCLSGMTMVLVIDRLRLAKR